MRYVEFPPDQLCIVANKKERESVSYNEFLDEWVWTSAKWRDSEEMARVRNRLIVLFDDAFARGVRGVGIADKDFEKWEPIAAARGMAIPPQNVRPISVFTDAAMFATTVEPDWAQGASGE